MKKLSYLFALVVLLNACDSSTGESEKALSDVSGHWISRDYLITLDKTLSPQGVTEQFPFYATEIILNNSTPDSITIFNGQIETFTLPFKRNGDTLNLKLNQDTVTQIIYNASRKTLSFFDKSLNRTYTFIKAENGLIDQNVKPATAFQTAVNKTVLEGNWQIIDGDTTKTPLQFSPFGQITGWDKYLTYTICINGDCAANEDGDIIILNNTNTSDEYGFRAKKDTLTFYKLTQRNDPDEKPVYQNGQALWVLVRKE